MLRITRPGTPLSTLSWALAIWPNGTGTGAVNLKGVQAT